MSGVHLVQFSTGVASAEIAPPAPGDHQASGDQPFDAAVTAYGEFRYFYRQRTKPWDDLSDYEQEGWRQFIAAALPALTEAITIQATTTEREACAQLAETEAQYWASHGNTIQAATLRVFADLIRKRGAQ